MFFFVENIYPCPPVTQPPPAVKIENLEIPLPPFQQQYSSEVVKPKDEIKTESSQVRFTLIRADYLYFAP